MNLEGSCVVLPKEQPLVFPPGCPVTYTLRLFFCTFNFETTMFIANSEVKIFERTGTGSQECVTPIPVSECRADGTGWTATHLC